MVGVQDLREHLLPLSLIGPPEHDARVDTPSLTPGREAAPGRAPEEDPSVDALTVPVAAAGASGHGRRGGQLEERVDAAEHERVDVQHQHLLVLHQAHGLQLREDPVEARLPVVVQRAHALDVVDLVRLPPTTGKQIYSSGLDVICVNADEVVRCAQHAQRLRQDHGPEAIFRSCAPQHHDVGILLRRHGHLGCFILHRAGKLHLDGPLATWAEAFPKPVVHALHLAGPRALATRRGQHVALPRRGRSGATPADAAGPGAEAGEATLDHRERQPCSGLQGLQQAGAAR
mmetsp:Transcript_96885/g.278253  ORF Transcript_96885/g.278253 Transcript_96885/m.278253 type:complete len:288 (+) Transcript_96885:1406-2269(+)